MEFVTTVELGGKTATGLPVPPEVVSALGSGQRPKVRVTIHGYTYRTTVAPYSGAFYLPLAAEHRAAAGVSAGDVVTVGIELDTAPRVIEPPADLAAALAAAPAAQSAWDGLSYSHKRQHVLAIEEAKTAETRARRVAKAVGMLGGG